MWPWSEPSGHARGKTIQPVPHPTDVTTRTPRDREPGHRSPSRGLPTSHTGGKPMTAALTLLVTVSVHLCDVLSATLGVTAS